MSSKIQPNRPSLIGKVVKSITDQGRNGGHSRFGRTPATGRAATLAANKSGQAQEARRELRMRSISARVGARTQRSVEGGALLPAVSYVEDRSPLPPAKPGRSSLRTGS